MRTDPWAPRARTSGTKRIGDEPTPCAHYAHNPPMHMVFKPGRYEHTCPACGHRQTFTVPMIIT